VNYSFITEPEFESSGTMVVHSPHHLKVKGSNLTSTVCTRKENYNNTEYVSECPQFDPLLLKQNPTPNVIKLFWKIYTFEYQELLDWALIDTLLEAKALI
jgi:hypothetical protein